MNAKGCPASEARQAVGGAPVVKCSVGVGMWSRGDFCPLSICPCRRCTCPAGQIHSSLSHNPAFWLLRSTPARSELGRGRNSTHGVPGGGALPRPIPPSCNTGGRYSPKRQRLRGMVTNGDAMLPKVRFLVPTLAFPSTLSTISSGQRLSGQWSIGGKW